MHDFYVLSATAIPVLLVAGALRSDLLRKYSISKLGAWLLEIQVIVGIIGTITAIYGAAFTTDGSIGHYICFAFTNTGLVTGAMYMCIATHQALHDNPPPARLRREKQELERRLATITSTLDNDRS